MYKKRSIMLLAILVVGLIINPSFIMAKEEPLVLETDSEEPITVQPMWNYIGDFANSFNISNIGRARVESSLISFKADQIKIQSNLQQFKNGRWTTIKSWSSSSKIASCILGGTWYVLHGYYYRAVTTGMVYKGSKMVEQNTYTSNLWWY